MNIISYLFNRFVPSQSPFLSPKAAHSQQPVQSQPVDSILQQLKQAIPDSRLTTSYGQDELVIRITWGEKGVPSQDVASETPLQRNAIDNQGNVVKGETTHTLQHQLMKRLIPFFEQHNRYYHRTSPIEEVLHDHVEFTAPSTEGARLLSAARLFQLLQKKNPDAMRGTTCYALTRLLPTVAEKVHTRYGNGYWVKVRT